MSWHYSRALEVAFSEASCLDGGAFAPLSATSTPDESSSQGRTTDALTRSRFGTMSGHSTADRGGELLTLYREDFRVRTSALPEREGALQVSEVDFGRKWLESSMRFDLPSSSWRTHLCLFDEVYQECCLTLPEWGSMRDGVVWERIQWDCRTEEIESGFWPTPVKFDAFQAGMMPRNGDTVFLDSFGKPRKRFEDGRTASMGLTRLVIYMTGKFPRAEAFEELMGWPNGWTECPSSEMARFRRWLQAHSTC